jgi:hypothetical protein
MLGASQHSKQGFGGAEGFEKKISEQFSLVKIVYYSGKTMLICTPKSGHVPIWRFV